MIQRREFMAEMSLKYCEGSARLTETTFGWSRFAIKTIVDPIVKTNSLKSKEKYVVYIPPHDSSHFYL